MNRDDIFEALIVEVCRDGSDYTVSGDYRITDKDAARLLCMSSRQARQLREEGSAWPRHAVPMCGCAFSVFVEELATWIASRAEKSLGA